MEKPIIFTNFKIYQTATGELAEELAKIHEAAAEKFPQIEFWVAPQAADIYRISKQVSKTKIWAQNIDPVEFGSGTGAILPESVKNSGAVGTILNHSEKRFSDLQKLEKTIEKAKKAGLQICVCAESSEEIEKFSQNSFVDFLAIESPELIGGDISVATAKPELISDTIAKSNGKKILVGAGIKNSQDCKIAKKLGAVGVLLASGITKSPNPLEVLQDLAQGFLD